MKPAYCYDTQRMPSVLPSTVGIFGCRFAAGEVPES
jgi:hypothetical protein